MQPLDFNKNYCLEDDWVLLRPLTSGDAEHLLAFAINEPTLWQYSITPANGEDNLIKYIETAVNARTNQSEYPFIVFDKKTQVFAGSTRFYDIQLSNKMLQLGYTWYGKEFQGTGLNKHCKFLLLQFAFETLEMERVEFRADNRNIKSIAAMKSIGCTEEGVLRSHALLQDGHRRDSIILSILRKEWLNGIKDKLSERIY